MFGIDELTKVMWPVSVGHLVACGAVTVLVLILGLIYTHIRQNGMNSIAAREAAISAANDKWNVGDGSSEQEDHKSPESDPMEFCSHIQGRIKQTKQRIAQQKIEAKMSASERNEEREIQRRQLEEIFQMMEDQKEKFGVSDVSDIREQLKMYVQ